MENRTKRLVHKIRFANLALEQNEIAKILGITDRYWHKLKNDMNNLSDNLFDKIRVIGLIHRPFPFEIISKDNGSSLPARSMQSHLRKATDLDEVMEVLCYLEEYLEKDKNDWGLLHLSASASFAIFQIILDNTDNDPPFSSVKNLEKAQKYWEESAKQPALSKKPLLTSLFETNSLTSKIYKEYFLKNKKCQEGNNEHYMKFRSFADQISKEYNVPAIWRDCLEQSCLLKDEKIIQDNFEKLLEAIKKMEIEKDKKIKYSIIDNYEVVLKEIEEIDSFEEVEKLPLFKKWKEELQESYSALRKERKR